MHVIFDSPAGFWALLGIPALIIIHTLQARARRSCVSTLFLLERLAPESRGGWQWDRLRNSLPLWLQILAVLILAWLLAGPRWLRPDASQHVVVVLDSSLSMEASLPETRTRLPARLSDLLPLAMHTEWTLLESDPRLPALYRGDSLDGLAKALTEWRPKLGTHDFAPALQVASSLVRGNGIVIFVTDHPLPSFDGGAVLSFAHPRDNAGFSGASVEVTEQGAGWRAFVCNYGSSPRRLAWRIRVDQQEGSVQVLDLAASETRVIAGEFPPQGNRIDVQITSDDFPLDDRLPLLRPVNKELRVIMPLDGTERGLMERVLQSLPDVKRATTPAEADLVITRRTPNSRIPASAEGRASIVFPSATSKPVAESNKLDGWIVTEKHTLVAGTGWEALQCTDSAGLVPMAEDTPLVWRGGTPLVLLRQESPRPAPPVLLFNFQPSATNASRLPAFVILLRRYMESIRETLPRYSAINADTHQRIPLALGEGRGALVVLEGKAEMPLTAGQAQVYRAPARPGFFQVKQSDEVLLDGAVGFADTREANLSECAPVDTLSQRERALAHASSAPDPWRRLWMMILLVLLPCSWMAARRRNT